MKQIKRAILSVSDKSGLDELCRALDRHGVELFSTGGTLRYIADAGFDVKKVEELTGFPEMMEGRVKTLHPAIHGGILARRSVDSHMQAMKEQGFEPIDMVVVNLYPFKETLLKEGSTSQDIIENIDIGGPTMIRSAAKNFEDVAVVCESAVYADIIAELDKNKGCLDLDRRRDLARRAFIHTAAYDSLISGWFNREAGIDYPGQVTRSWKYEQPLRYGENPHQSAGYYIDELNRPDLEILQGKQMSYNNYLDFSAALDCAVALGEGGVAVIKHTNPSGAARAASLLESFKLARECDPVSAFGGIIAVYGEIDKALAESITENFVEIVAAPSYSAEALEVFAAKKNLRVIRCGGFTPPAPSLTVREVYGGMLLQQADSPQVHSTAGLKIVTEAKGDEKDLQGLLFAWNVARTVKSNAIVFTDHLRTLGIGAGQMSRVDSVEIGSSKAEKAGLSVKGAYMASDAFFPFRDSIDHAAKLGIKAIVQPGGSIRDEEVIAACNEHGIIMAFTGFRHFRH